MKYYTDLFSPETHSAFSDSDRTISGFRETQHGYAPRIKIGDKLVCYVTRISRWAGLLEVISDAFLDNTPIFVPERDPFIVRFRVKPLIWLSLENAIPIHSPVVWEQLSFTRGRPMTSSQWTGQVRNSLRTINDEDGYFLEQLLLKQQKDLKSFPLSTEDRKALKRQTVKRDDREVDVTIPDEAPEDLDVGNDEARESIRMQALLGKIGAMMGFKVWIPRNDRSAVTKEWPEGVDSLVDQLPLNYNDTTIQTIERIDVLWLQGRAIQRAFEVEHTTSIYSGILRMADLLALQPNMDIRLHIVAPIARRQKVFGELCRPVFSLLERKPLSECCTFISYDSLIDIFKLPHLVHTRDRVIEEYEEMAE